VQANSFKAVQITLLAAALLVATSAALITHEYKRALACAFFMLAGSQFIFSFLGGKEIWVWACSRLSYTQGDGNTIPSGADLN
jgi:hypothetical protein